jgi:FAD/FMN-containing dehydrogenase
MAPSDLRSIEGADTGPFVAEVGVGTLHATLPQPRRELDPNVAELNARVKTQFDPTGRLNPGRSVV